MIDQLKVPLTSVGDKGVKVDATVSSEDLRPEGARELSVSHVHVEGVLSAVSTEYLFRGRISGAYKHACDRCLTVGEYPFEFEVVWFFELGTPTETLEDLEEFEADEASLEEEDRVRFFDGNEINLAEHVWEELVLMAPTKYLCDEDCQGLCAKCGANLNETECGCSAEPERSDSGLAALADMFPDLRPKSSEE